jgi:predicted DNA-binding protein (MmcQ/YjbR family)
MTPEEFHDVALRLPAAHFDVKWGEDRIYSVGGRMFAAAGRLGDRAPLYMFKASELAFAVLIEAAIARPAPYLARAGWVQLLSSTALPPEELSRHLAEAHRLVCTRLPKRIRREILGEA